MASPVDFRTSALIARSEKKLAAESIGALVTAHLRCAAQPVKAQNVDALVQCLDRAVALSEEHPREVHEPAGHLDTLLKIIRLARRVCNAYARPDDDLRTIEQRAENLSGLQLH
jgi:hypothetical protein